VGEKIGYTVNHFVNPRRVERLTRNRCTVVPDMNYYESNRYYFTVSTFDIRNGLIIAHIRESLSLYASGFIYYAAIRFVPTRPFCNMCTEMAVQSVHIGYSWVRRD